MLKAKRRSLFSAQLDNLPENDDALEQNHRRSIASPARRKSLSSSAHDMMVHFTQCLKLSSENKINPGNAFQLQMIDHMMSMLTSKDSKMDNFQIASFTLDASTKIYASRVDKIHSDGVRIAGGLFKAAFRNKQLSKADDELGGDDDELKNECKTKRRAQIRRKKILAQPAVLNAPLQQNYKLVPSFLFMKAMFSDCRPGFVNFTRKVSVDDNVKQRFLFSELAFEKPEIRPQDNILEKFPKKPDLKGMKVTRHNIEPADFLADDLSSGVHQCDINEKLNVSAVTEKLKMDLQLENNFEDDPCHTYQETFAATKEAVADVGDGGPQTHSPEQLDIFDIRANLAQKPQEYSYFNIDKLSLWRGPSHWKLFSSKGKPERTKKGKTKQKQKQKKVVKELFTDEIVPNVDDKLQIGKLQRLAKRTTQRWQDTNVTSQVDVHYDYEQFRRLFLNVVISLQFTYERKPQKTVPEVVDDDNVVEYDYNNPTDTLEYCPNVPDGDESSSEDTEKGDKEFTELKEQDTEKEQQATEVTEENMTVKDDNDVMWKLLTPPHQAAKITIPYAKEPKKIDMAKLKSIMWSIITKFSAAGEGRSEDLESVINKPEGMATFFSKISFETKEAWPQETRGDLSFAILFQALLHLTNEKRMKLKSLDDLSDVIVFWPRENPPSRG